MTRYAYQVPLTDRIMECLAEPRRSVVLQLPTGGGKTRIASAVVSRCLAQNLSVWFVCHREEILQQTSDEFEEAGIPHGFLAAGRDPGHEGEVHICSVQSLPRRLATVAPPDVIVWDECQHTRAASWQRIKEHFSEAHHLGLSATPCRLDGKGLGDLFDEMICGPSTRELIALGALSPFRLFGPTIPDLRGVKTRRGDYEVSGLDEAMSKPVLVGDVVDHYKRLAPGARAIAFACSVKTSLAVVERFNAAGIPARHVDGKTPRDERRDALNALGAGEIKVLSNVEVFTEGLNIPAIDAVILLRPTKSLALYRQMIGRGLRPAEGKAATVILDHAGLVHEHGLPDEEITWTLDGHSRTAESGNNGEGRPRLRRCPECSAIHAWAPACIECGHVYVPGDRAIEEVYGELQPFRSHFSLPGSENRLAFAKRVGYAGASSVDMAIRNGLPTDINGHIPIDAGLVWMAQNKSNRGYRLKAEQGFMTRNDFARSVGLSVQTICNLVKRGLPQNEFKQINCKEAAQWLNSNRVRKTHRAKKGEKSLNQFASEHGLTYDQAIRLTNVGLPIDNEKRVLLPSSKMWVVENKELISEYVHRTKASRY